MTMCLAFRALTVLLLSLAVLQASPAEKIDRHALVTRHNIVITNTDALTPLSVGNGEFAFTADVTGLQTFPEFHEQGMSLSTMSQWGWHSFPNPEHYVLKDVLKKYDTHGRPVPYADGAVDGEVAVEASARAKAASAWLRANPHRLDLARIGFRLKKADGSTAAITSLSDVRQTLDLWSGLLESRFTLEGQLVLVQTVCHPDRDLIAVRIESPLLARRRAEVRIAFPYAAGGWQKAADWDHPDRYQTQVAHHQQRYDFENVLDADRYFVALEIDRNSLLRTNAAHEFAVSLPDSFGGGSVLEFVVAFAPDRIKDKLPDFSDVMAAAAKHWKDFWLEGGAVDLSGSTDPRWFELERRIVLSQYLTAINCAGSMPPQETGLVQNSWFGKPHLEMHWWHAAHFALWGRESLLERSLGWYQRILPVARDLAKSQGYAGVRWPKMTDHNGAQSPSSIGAFLIWEQPHPVFYAELLRRAHPGRATLRKYRDLVFETADFMADFAVWDAKSKCYVLGPPVIPAQESYGNNRANNLDPTYELAYWQWALSVARQWRKELGLSPNKKWDDVAAHLAKPAVRDGVYAALDTPPYTVPHDHPSMLCALGMLPPTDLIDPATMRRTLDHVFKVWDWPSTWGWDYPVMAMTAARVGEPDRAIDALFLDTPKNHFLANGHNYQRPNLPLYLPGNGGLLYATALMAAGWDCAPQRNAPGFPTNGWVVRWEGLRIAP